MSPDWPFPPAQAFASPLGPIPVDREGVAALRALPFVEVSDRAHAFEHSLEVHLPFLQSALDRFTLVPMVVGGAGAEEMASAFEAVWGGEETLVVVSSDLSHYLPYDAACRRDRLHRRNRSSRSTRMSIPRKRAAPRRSTGCSRSRAGAAWRRSSSTCAIPAIPRVTAGRVVGYASFAVSREAGVSADERRGEILIAIAREGIADEHGFAPRTPREAPWLAQPAATFVTLRLGGELRGCIGIDRGAAARSARTCTRTRAGGLPRFALRAGRRARARRARCRGLVLSTPEPIAAVSEAQALAELRPRRGRRHRALRESAARPSCRRSGRGCPIPSTS
jgi:hypothetical protein